jgi:DNA invertase Pin-like site-specific DNA recombinase
MSKRARTGNSLVAVAYIRVSKDDQKLGPEAQRASIEGWAAREGVQVVAWHVDQGVCSVTPVEGRPALVAALASLRQHGAGVLVMAKRDRIARDPMLTRAVEGEAARMGAVVVSAAGEASGGTAPADVMMRGVVDLFAEYERGLIRARTAAALAVIRARGHKTGGSLPYGFTLGSDGRTLVAVEGEQVTVARARQLSGEGCTLRAVAAQLAAEGRTSRTGRAFAAVQVSRMLAGAFDGQRTAA